LQREGGKKKRFRLLRGEEGKTIKEGSCVLPIRGGKGGEFFRRGDENKTKRNFKEKKKKRAPLVRVKTKEGKKKGSSRRGKNFLA